MNIILIDDDHSMVEMLKSTLHWNALDIDEILTAYNIQQAKSLFLENMIDIMLCDIEMPNGSGIELLEWLRNRENKVQTIFLTNHAEFHFAQQALQLECIDFVTKISSIEVIEAALRRAVNIAKTIQITNRYLNYGHHWEENRGLFCHKFWHDLCSGKILPEQTKIHSLADKYNIELDIEMQSILIYITASRYQEALLDWAESEKDFCIANIASEMLFNSPNSPYLVNLEKENKIALAAICHPMVTSIDIEELKNKCKELVRLFKKLLNCSIYFYISEPCHCEQFSNTIKRLDELDNNNVISDQTITLEAEPSFQASFPEDSADIHFEEIYPLLITGQTLPLISKVKEFFLIAQNKKLGSQFLYSFSQHYNQLLYTSIKEKDLELNQVLGDERDLMLYNHSTKSVYDLFKWITVSATRFSYELKNVKQPLSIIVDVKKYIDKNYHNRITKSELANFVFLSPDYLAKSFKKETGISLSDYITQVRIEKSKHLLNDLSISLTDVASLVGFDYYSYYSTVFKKQEGITPKEYRAGILNNTAKYNTVEAE